MPWHFVLCQTDGTPLGELTAAKSKSVTWPLDDAASASFTMDGQHPQASLISELATDLIVYDEQGVKRFRGRMGTSGDTIAAAGHQSTFSAVDYRGLLARRIIISALPYGLTDQAQIAWNEILKTINLDGLGITQGSGSTTGVSRVITFTVGQKISDAIDQLAKLNAGFEWEIDAKLAFNVYYPQRGASTSAVLEYGGTVQGVKRTLDSSTFANVVRFSADASVGSTLLEEPVLTPTGAFAVQVSDTTINDGTTLGLRANFEIARDSVLTPSYQLTLRDGWWTPAILWLGDTAQVVVKSGRINEISSQRVSQVQVQPGDNGGDIVTITTGPVPTDAGKDLQAALDRIYVVELSQ